MKKIFFLIVFTLQLSLACFSQDSLRRFTDAQVIKLANKIKVLEKRTAFYSATHPNDVFAVNPANSAKEKAVLTNLLSDSLHVYNDAQIIKFANYVKYLERLDSLNTIYVADIAKKHVADSIAKYQAALVANDPNNVKDPNDVVVPEQKDLDKYEKLIYFNFDSSVLKPESSQPLDEAVKILKSYPKLNFLIEGHTDSIGPVAYNLNLSNERARSVMNYFVSKGIPASRISSKGYGEARPVATNETEEGRAKNRRVEIRIKK